MIRCKISRGFSFSTAITGADYYHSSRVPVKVHWVAGIIHCCPHILSHCDRKADVSVYCGNFNKASQYALNEHILELKYITVNNGLN